MANKNKSVLVLATHIPILEALLHAKRLTPGEKLIALILVLSSNYEGKAELTVHDLVKRTGYERRTIYRHMSGLRKKTHLQRGKNSARNTYYWPQWMMQ
jgi:DNA-binding transcriptional ArsR family regulator